MASKYICIEDRLLDVFFSDPSPPPPPPPPPTPKKKKKCSDHDLKSPDLDLI